MQNANILSVGAYAPALVLDNQYFNDLLGEDVGAWLSENVHIHRRHWCADDESTADLAEKAALQALERAGVAAADLDLIIVATDTPEYISPSTAAVLQYRLGATRAGTFDLNTACAGFVTALDTASKYIQADPQYQRVLVVGAYAMSKYLNKTDKKTVTLFADGAGAVVLGAAPRETGKGFLASRLLTHGEYHEWMGIYAGGTHQPVDANVLENRGHQLQFVRKFPKELNPEIWSRMAIELSERSGIDLKEVDQFFITQININAIWETLDRLNLPHEKGHTIMQEYGYTGSACIPMAFNDAWEKGLVKPGDTVFFIGSGGGLAFAAAAFRI
ncbi:MAG TPA: ketoacyl-ACP synthase III [Saprospiraceae bacterium]|nr:ketoacyl-ACP synthase III [Saprospiraceae bacterium]HPI08134.1 ketoacyl-ACP synthase III [Saprospiraceae bacterium]